MSTMPAEPAQPAPFDGIFDGLIDDAAVFPPGSLPLDAAVKAHREHKRAWYGPLVGPLLLPAASVADLPEQLLPLDRTAPIRLGLVADASGLSGLRAARDLLLDEERVELVHVEVRLPRLAAEGSAGSATTALLEALDFSVAAFVEVPLESGWIEALDVLANDAAERAKFRTGGVTPEAFLGEERLARALVACVDRRLRFKLTAGLHHAVRTTAAPGGLEMHGVLNVLLAIARALEGATPTAVAATLARRDTAAIVADVRQLDAPTINGIRRLWLSFGCCGVTDPIDDLRSLGLLGGAPG